MKYLSDFETGARDGSLVPVWIVQLVPGSLSLRALGVFCKGLSMVDAGSFDADKLREASGLSPAQFNAVALELAACGLALSVHK